MATSLGKKENLPEEDQNQPISHPSQQASRERSDPTDKVKAALVIQSIYRGYRVRDQLRKKRKLPFENQDDSESGALSDDLALKDGPEEEKSSLAVFSKQVSILEKPFTMWVGP